VVGGEAEARVRVTDSFSLRLGGAVARTVARTETLPGAPELQNSMFPPVQAHGVGEYRLGGGFVAAVEASFLAARTSSQSNALLSGDPYTLPSYVYTAVSVSTGPRKWLGDRETQVTARLQNALNTRYVDPGFGGVDIPAQGITGILTLTQSL
jgi:iron complex outermembrane receptor protein